MNHHARGFVDDRQVVIFIDNIERNLFGNGAQRWSVRRPSNRDLLVTPQSQRRLRRRGVHQHLALRDELLHTGATDL